MKRMTVSIIVHEDFSHIQRALQSLIASTQHELEIYLTINTRSNPQKVAELHNRFPQITVRVNEQPRGFAANHNSILALAATDYVLLINDDIEAAPQMLDRLIQYLDDQPKVGLASPSVLKPDGSPQIMAYSDPSLLRMIYRISGIGHFTRHGSSLRRRVLHSPLRKYLKTASLQRYTHTQFVPVVVGVAMCVRRSAYQQAGVMDEDTRVYGEEFGWQWRLRQHGWQIALVTDTFVTHFNVDHPLHGWVLTEHRKGILNYFVRYKPRWQAWVLRSALVVLHGVRGLLYLLVDRRQVMTEWRTVSMALTFRPKR